MGSVAASRGLSPRPDFTKPARSAPKLYTGAAIAPPQTPQTRLSIALSDSCRGPAHLL